MVHEWGSAPNSPLLSFHNKVICGLLTRDYTQNYTRYCCLTRIMLETLAALRFVTPKEKEILLIK